MTFVTAAPEMVASSASEVARVGSTLGAANAEAVGSIDPQTGNAIHPYGPPGCDMSLPVVGLGQ